MTVILISTPKAYIGDTADAKPTSVSVGSTYYDRQTGLDYITYDGTNWAAGPAGDAVTVAQLPTALAASGGLKVEGVAGGVAQPVSIASAQVASGAVASGAIASGAVASGAIASGAVASGAIASGAFSSGAITDGADVTQGAKADSKSDKTDNTAVTIMQVLKEISYMEQTPASRAVTLATAPALVASSAVIGNVGGITKSIQGQPVLTVAGAYTANDYVGTSATPITFANAARVIGGGGVIQRAVLVDYALQSLSMELWLFDTLVTPPADNAAWSISDVHAATCIGVIPFTTYYASAVNSVSPAPNLGVAFNCAVGDTAIYGCLVTRGAPTYASLDLVARLVILQD